ncbi:uncharacterized protein BDZ99DRAFT_237679 [Mytilinidion resinicola]|uniref:Uncharacterized protein n=1 Tax=Mytilinidion resinicola TaxID=574789 RepID=A0A6A6YZU4_9PEZI|nr:uncharacterized protein BDZ99DRAFT_237679 [Mytilinidion resinicola]KAF2814446.1 hypothetical protein BDZ99DRAFT_237679 [Mytilinidion resinicola]
MTSAPSLQHSRAVSQIRDQRSRRRIVTERRIVLCSRPNGQQVRVTTRFFRMNVGTTWVCSIKSAFYLVPHHSETDLRFLNSDGCSLPGDNNVMNWKHGGSMSDNNGVKYTIIPTQNRPPPPISPQGECYAVPHWWGYRWHFYGGGFADSDYG